MSELIELLWPTPREQSILAWLIFGLVVCLSVKGIRDAVWNLLSVFFSFKIQLMVWISLVWTSLCCYFMWHYGYWDKTLLKDTVVWAVSSGIVFTFRAVSRKGISFIQVLLDNLKISTLLSFFVNIYSFELWVELIIFPVMIFVFLMDAVAQVKDELRESRKITSAIVAFCGAVYFCSSAWLFADRITPGQLFDESLKLLFPIVLYITAIPSLYFWFMVSLYENLFIIFHTKSMRDKSELASVAKWKIFMACHLNPFALRMLVNSPMFRARIINSKTLAEIDQSICLALDGKLDNDF